MELIKENTKRFGIVCNLCGSKDVRISSCEGQMRGITYAELSCNKCINVTEQDEHFKSGEREG